MTELQPQEAHPGIDSKVHSGAYVDADVTLQADITPTSLPTPLPVINEHDISNLVVSLSLARAELDRRMESVEDERIERLTKIRALGRSLRNIEWHRNWAFLDVDNARSQRAKRLNLMMVLDSTAFQIQLHTKALGALDLKLADLEAQYLFTSEELAKLKTDH